MSSISRNACSYCGCQGHNIRTCDHPSINYYIQHMKYRYQLYSSAPYQAPNLIRSLFCCYLDQCYNADHIRAVVVHLRIGTTSLSKRHGIQRICNYFDQQSNIVVPYPDIPPSYAHNIVDTRVSIHSQSLNYITHQLIEGNWITSYRQQPTNIQLSAPSIIPINTIKMNFVSSYNEQSDNTFDCPICLDCIDQNDGVKLNCSHLFCSTCISQLVKLNTNDITCALCRENITAINVTSNDVCEKLKTCGNRIQIE
jgi:hypothetical protein